MSEAFYKLKKVCEDSSCSAEDFYKALCDFVEEVKNNKSDEQFDIYVCL